MGRVENKVALITGAARGQGRSHAIRLAEEGADIIAVDLCDQIDSVPYGMSTPDDLAETARLVEALDRRISIHQADVRDLEQMGSAVQAGIAQIGPIDIVVANAGIFSHASTREMTAQVWQDMIDVNLTGVFNSFRAVAPHMRRQGSGRVIATASMAGRGGFAQIGHYVAAKWGLIGLTKSFALEMGTHHVTANVVAPTNVNTDMIQNDAARRFFVPDVESPTEADAAKAMSGMTGMGIPWVEPSDISGAILYLVSDSARYVTGEVLHVAAGMNAFNAV
jgi:(+)-trans-carveol dehydrogenase